MLPNGRASPIYRQNETRQQRRIRYLNKKVAAKLEDFVELVSTWAEMLYSDHPKMSFDDAPWAYGTLSAVAREIKDTNKLLVERLDKNGLIDNLESVNDNRTAHFVYNYLNKKGGRFRMGPIGNLSDDKYIFVTSCCLDQKVRI